MGGIAAIAKAAGYRVTGCDSNVYPPMSDQLRALGIELTEGFDENQLKLRPDAGVVAEVSGGCGRDRQRGHARQPAHGSHPRPGWAVCFRAAVAGGKRPGREACARYRGYAREDDRFGHARVGAGARWTLAGIPDRGRPDGFPGFG